MNDKILRPCVATRVSKHREPREILLRGNDGRASFYEKQLVWRYMDVLKRNAEILQLQGRVAYQGGRKSGATFSLEIRGERVSGTNAYHAECARELSFLASYFRK